MSPACVDGNARSACVRRVGAIKPPMLPSELISAMAPAATFWRRSRVALLEFEKLTYTGLSCSIVVSSVAPLALTNAASINGSATNLNTIRLSFDRAVDASTLTADDLVLAGPDGKAVAVTVKQVAGYAGNVFDVTFAAQTAAGTYTLKVGPAITDAQGVAMSAVVARMFALA